QRPCDVVPPVHVGHRQFDLAPVLDEPLTEPHVANPVRARPQDVEVGVVQALHARTPTPRRPHSMAVAWTHIPALLDSWTLWSSACSGRPISPFAAASTYSRATWTGRPSTFFHSSHRRPAPRCRSATTASSPFPPRYFR